MTGVRSATLERLRREAAKRRAVVVTVHCERGRTCSGCCMTITRGVRLGQRRKKVASLHFLFCRFCALKIGQEAFHV